MFIIHDDIDKKKNRLRKTFSKITKEMYFKYSIEYLKIKIF